MNPNKISVQYITNSGEITGKIKATAGSAIYHYQKYGNIHHH